MTRIAVALTIEPLGVYIAPNGAAMSTSRIGEVRDGVVVSSPNLSNAEIERLGLTGVVSPNTDANSERLYQRARIESNERIALARTQEQESPQ